MVKFSEDTCKCLIENHGKGLPIKDCADIAGIDRTLVYKWMDKGKKAKKGKYHDFYLDMQKYLLIIGYWQFDDLFFHL